MAITFPNRPCPKCGKPIHIKTRSHECGWKANGAAGTKMKPGRPAAANGKISKMEAVRRVIGDTGSGTKPADIQDEVKKRFNIKMDTGTISNYKSTIMRLAARKKPGRKPGRPAKAHTATRATGASISIDDIKAVKTLAERIGVDKLRQLADVLAT
ncbi:hypothetical protein AYO40_06315 [Planctomycetaceae bacterium SCGC AG-212-D15]|nr:hypothetical protein AYO40_06315 [Planctomycetaceae bacterium SCGC AG-212-D15]